MFHCLAYFSIHNLVPSMYSKCLSCCDGGVGMMPGRGVLVGISETHNFT